MWVQLGLSQVPSESQASPNQVPGESKQGPGQVPSKSYLGSVRSQAGLKRVLNEC